VLSPPRRAAALTDGLDALINIVQEWVEMPVPDVVSFVIPDQNRT
jgi:hypothetical protein